LALTVGWKLGYARVGGFLADVLELPTILVTGKSVEELTQRATEAIQLHWETTTRDGMSSTAFRKEIEVELPA
jgi:predicted RNase H-like HicB family nuclease